MESLEDSAVASYVPIQLISTPSRLDSDNSVLLFSIPSPTSAVDDSQRVVLNMSVSFEFTIDHSLPDGAGAFLWVDRSRLFKASVTQRKDGVFAFQWSGAIAFSHTTTNNGHTVALRFDGAAPQTTVQITSAPLPGSVNTCVMMIARN